MAVLIIDFKDLFRRRRRRIFLFDPKQTLYRKKNTWQLPLYTTDIATDRDTAVMSQVTDEVNAVTWDVAPFGRLRGTDLSTTPVTGRNETHSLTSRPGEKHYGF